MLKWIGREDMAVTCERHAGK